MCIIFQQEVIVLSKKLSLAVMLCLFLSVLLFSSCRSEQKEEVDITTSISLNHSFSGTRTIVMTFPNSIIAPGSETETNLDRVVEKYCPDSMTYAKNKVDDKISYSFSLKFEDKRDYVQKTTELRGSQTIVSFSNPTSVMTNGWKLEENFESSELLGWICEEAKNNDYTGFDFTTKESLTNVSLDGQIFSSQPKISVNCLNGIPVQKLSVTTINKKDDNFDRTISFTLGESDFKNSEKSIREYFKNQTHRKATYSEWDEQSNAATYTVKFTNVSLTEMVGCTNQILDTIYCKAEYNDKSIGSTALAEQNSFVESIDFSSFIGLNKQNVPVEYSYSMQDTGAELSEAQIYDNGDWVRALDLLSTNRYGHLAAIKSNDSYLQIKVNDGKQYIASSIDVVVKPTEGNKVQKSITFKYDIAKDGNLASKYASDYFAKLNIGAELNLEGDKNTCTITFSGTPDELNAKIPAIFGEKNLIHYSSKNQFMMLRTMKSFDDHVDFSSLITGKNSKIPVYYSLETENGDIVKTFNINSTDPETKKETHVSSDLKKNEKGLISFDSSKEKFNASDFDIEFSVSSPNVSEIIFCCIVSFIVVLISVFMLFVFRSRKSYVGLGPGSSHTALPGDKKQLAVRKQRKNSITPKNDRENKP